MPIWSGCGPTCSPAPKALPSANSTFGSSPTTCEPSPRPAGYSRLGVSIDDYHGILRDTAQCRLFSLEETLDEPGTGRDLPASDAATPDQELDQSQFRDTLAQAINRLPEREKLVLSLYYEQELNLKEIGEVLGVSESRVCQIHGQALIHLRAIVDK
jgi:RNA polymerase sigma factor for flagellar operon FliA